jgi:hypothetical protein
MAKRKSNRPRYTTGGRIDYRTGGRVGYATGDQVGFGRTGEPGEPEFNSKAPATAPAPAPATAPSPAPAPSSGSGSASSQTTYPTYTPEELAAIKARAEAAAKAGKANAARAKADAEAQSAQADVDKADAEASKAQAESDQAESDAAAREATSYSTPRTADGSSGYPNKQATYSDGKTPGEPEPGDSRPPYTPYTPYRPPSTPYTPPPAPTPSPDDEQSQAARDALEAAAKGEVAPNAQVDPEDVFKVQEDIEQKETEMEATDPAKAYTAKKTADEDVSTVDKTSTARTPEEVEAAKYRASLIKEAAEAEAAKGEVSDQSIADSVGVGDVPPIDSAEVEVEEGALVGRVVGKISDEAKATAAQNAGTSLARITRAKKQLANAGLSEADIAELGNDPEALEARLADFTEEERGIIEGLPEEALVSNQLDGLLQGMENGEIPLWAKPAVSQVEQMLARRGLSASTIGRDALFNAIIQAAMPMAQSNAQAIQASVAQQKEIEFRTDEANAQRKQQVALSNADKVFNMNMAQFNADQQREIINSQFMQTVSIKNADNKQQAAIQDAVLLSQRNIAEADLNTKIQIQNAQAFLSMDMANLNNQQQTNMINAQYEQQRLLSNQSAQNAAKQFNATSENQVNQFNASLAANISQFNAQQKNAMAQFNAAQENAAEARNKNREADRQKFNAQIRTSVDQFNTQMEFQRNQWNAQNAAAVEASNVAWRRKANTMNTAAQNQANMFNAQNAFQMSSQANAFMWQELRDQAAYDFQAKENEYQRKASLAIAALGNEGGSYQGKNWSTNLNSALSVLKNFTG